MYGNPWVRPGRIWRMGRYLLIQVSTCGLPCTEVLCASSEYFYLAPGHFARLIGVITIGRNVLSYWISVLLTPYFFNEAASSTGGSGPIAFFLLHFQPMFIPRMFTCTSSINGPASLKHSFYGARDPSEGRLKSISLREFFWQD